MVGRLKFIALLALAFGVSWAMRPKPQNVDADARLPRNPAAVRGFLETHCYGCHDSATKKGGLDLTSLKFDLADARTFATWVKVHDRVRDGEMPPGKKAQPDDASRATFLKTLAGPMIAADDARVRREGRAAWRRMNRYEYENTLRDLLGAPWLQVKEMLPEDGEAFRFNKVGEALDVSHVQMSRYLAAAEYALREAMAQETVRPATATKRYYAREQNAFARRVKYTEFNRHPERATFPLLDNAADIPTWRNPLAQKDGQPGVAFRWLEVEGPIHDQWDEWPGKGHRLMFGDLPIEKNAKGGMEIVSQNPRADAANAERLLRGFMQRAYRRPVTEEDVQRFLQLTQTALDAGAGFTDAMITAYSAVLCSPAFVTFEEKPGLLDNRALATRLAYFLWNSEPDAALRSLADRGALRKPDALRAQTERLLADGRSQRFVEAFLDYWLDLRKINNTSPDAALYSDYYLDDFLVESAADETRRFFAELLRGDLPARNLVASDFVMVNERLAAHYGLAAVKGVELQRVALPQDSLRGGLLTQASVLKVTANGTTTSPVLRGVWIMERILGKPVPPPPAAVPAVEPDTRGATTIRVQLDKHRTQPSCNVCHAKIDPAGFALESFDVLGGWRDRYRALGEGEKAPGNGKNGQPFEYHYAQPVDASSVLADGRRFQDVRELKRLLLQDERQIARNLAGQIITFATGAPVRFGDRPKVEAILDSAASKGYGVKSLIQALIESELFRNK